MLKLPPGPWCCLLQGIVKKARLELRVDTKEIRLFGRTAWGLWIDSKALESIPDTKAYLREDDCVVYRVQFQTVFRKMSSSVWNRLLCFSVDTKEIRISNYKRYELWIDSDAVESIPYSETDLHKYCAVDGYSFRLTFGNFVSVYRIDFLASESIPNRFDSLMKRDLNLQLQVSGVVNRLRSSHWNKFG